MSVSALATTLRQRCLLVMTNYKVINHLWRATTRTLKPRSSRPRWFSKVISATTRLQRCDAIGQLIRAIVRCLQIWRMREFYGSGGDEVEGGSLAPLQSDAAWGEGGEGQKYLRPRCLVQVPRAVSCPVFRNASITTAGGLVSLFSPRISIPTV